MTDPATAEDRRAAIRARLDAATEGPWIKSGHDVDGNANVGAFCQDCTPPCGALGERVATAGDADAELIANAPADLSWLLSELEAAQARLTKVAEATPEQVAAWIDPEAWRHVEPHSSEYFKKRGAQAEYEANFAESVRQRREPSLAAAKRVLAKLLSGSARALGLGEEGDDGE